MKQTLPVKKNDYIDVTFEDLTHEGAGVAKVDGYPLFVPNALPGEKAQIKVLKTSKGYGFGKLIETYEESPYRVTAPCPIYKECGGCQLQHLSYEGQLLAKQKQVRDVLTRIGKLENVTVHPTIGMSDPWRYRNKSQVPIGEHEGGLIGGFYQQRSHQIIDMKSCLIQQEKMMRLFKKSKRSATKMAYAYDEQRHKGDLRHIMARYGLVTGDVMIVLVTKAKDLPNRKKIIADITENITGVKSIVQNVNPKKTNVIMGDETRVLWGQEVIYDYIGDVRFAISARSFYQVNPEQTKVLYDKALEYAALTGKEEVIDAYCGIGTISLFLAQKPNPSSASKSFPKPLKTPNATPNSTT